MTSQIELISDTATYSALTGGTHISWRTILIFVDFSMDYSAVINCYSSVLSNCYGASRNKSSHIFIIRDVIYHISDYYFVVLNGNYYTD